MLTPSSSCPAAAPALIARRPILSAAIRRTLHRHALRQVLGAQLDRVLAASPLVRGTGPDPAVETVEVALGLFPDGGLVIRRVTLPGGRAITLVLVPADRKRAVDLRQGVLALKRLSRRMGGRVLLVPEAALARWSRLAAPLPT